MPIKIIDTSMFVYECSVADIDNDKIDILLLAHIFTDFKKIFKKDLVKITIRERCISAESNDGSIATRHGESTPTNRFACEVNVWFDFVKRHLMVGEFSRKTK